MDGISTANTRAALNGADPSGAGVAALKAAAQAEKAIVQVVEQAVEQAARPPAPEGQGRNVDRLV